VSKFQTYRFEKLDVWQIARELKRDIYAIGATMPVEEKYGLTRQLQRAMTSITANLAEGSGRSTPSDQAYFVNMAYASGLEVLDHIITCMDLGLLSESQYTDFRIRLDELLNKLNAYYRHLVRNGNGSLKDKITRHPSDNIL
jgi:four helix bundle protein